MVKKFGLMVKTRAGMMPQKHLGIASVFIAIKFDHVVKKFDLMVKF